MFEYIFFCYGKQLIPDFFFAMVSNWLPIFLFYCFHQKHHANHLSDSSQSKDILFTLRVAPQADFKVKLWIVSTEKFKCKIKSKQQSNAFPETIHPSYSTLPRAHTHTEWREKPIFHSFYKTNRLPIGSLFNSPSSPSLLPTFHHFSFKRTPTELYSCVRNRKPLTSTLALACLWLCVYDCMCVCVYSKNNNNFLPTTSATRKGKTLLPDQPSRLWQKGEMQSSKSVTNVIHTLFLHFRRIFLRMGWAGACTFRGKRCCGELECGAWRGPNNIWVSKHGFKHW